MGSNKHDEDKRLCGNVGDSDDGDKDARDVGVDDVQPVDVDGVDDLHLDVECQLVYCLYCVVLFHHLCKWVCLFFELKKQKFLLM